MLIDYPDTLTADSFTERDIYDELLSIENELDQQLIAAKIRARAKVFGLTQVFDNNYKTAQKEFAKVQKRELANNTELFGVCMTDFSLRDQAGGQFNCGDWVADDEGVRLHTDKGLQMACSHPIFISKILRNVETGKFKAEIIYQLPGRAVRTIYVDRKTLASASKILDIADDGVIVTSLNAPLLVKYFADLQTLNPELIEERSSTSRLGWINGFSIEGKPIKQFLPYQSDIIFDNFDMLHIFDSIRPCGSRDKWYSHIREIRAKRQPEVLINLASSFASVLLEACGGSPFIVSLWGGTGIGKTVILKLCASVWANPKEGNYIASSKSTYTATEIQLNLLNSLPLMIDDMAQLTIQSDIGLQDIIYNCCAGQGKGRATKELGLHQQKRWKNCIITNGERSLVDESMQGGAINRVIDIESSGEALFDGKSGNKTVRIIEANYGFAGEEFIDEVSRIGFQEIEALYDEYQKKIEEAAAKKGVEKEGKQSGPMALILVADYLTEKYLFQDGVRIDMDQALDYLRNKGDISETETAYERILDLIAINENHFASSPDYEIDNPNIGQWGCYLDDDMKYIAIIPEKFKEMVGSNSLEKAFKSWASRVGILDTDRDKRFTKTVRYHGKPRKMIVFDTTWDKESHENAVNTSVSGDDNSDLPFT